MKNEILHGDALQMPIHHRNRLTKFRHFDLFSGIGGFAYAAKQVWGNEYECIGFCDNDKYCQALLSRRFPNVKIWDDIRELSITAYATEQRLYNEKDQQELESERGNELDIEQSRSVCDLITGGFPCQPFSCAGKRKGSADDRFLWDEMYRVICEFVPRWVIAENVKGLLTIEQGMVFHKVLTDLEKAGYDVQPYIIPACAVNAPHRRDRVWIVGKLNTANTERSGEQGQYQQQSGQGELGRCNGETFTNTICEGLEGKMREGEQGSSRRLATQDRRQSYDWNSNWVEVATEFCGVDDGLPAELDGFKLSKSRHRVERLKALGNSIVPQVAMEIMRAIKQYDEVNQ